MTAASHAAWVTLRLVAPRADVDLAVAALWEAGVAGIEERPAGEGVELRAGVPAGALDPVLAALGERWPTEVEAVDDTAWRDAWRAHARAWRAGRRIVVAPAWTPLPDWAGSDDLVVRIDPGQAFGSGSHPTTRDCLAELETLVGPGSTVLDAGSGSGVLAVAAALLGAARVRAVDVDPEAVRATAANVGAAGVADRVEVSDDPVGAGAEPVDVVVANIGAATLEELADDLVAALAPAGTLVLSGLLAEQVDRVLDRYRARGLVVRRTVADGEWRTVVLDRGAPGGGRRGRN